MTIERLVKCLDHMQYHEIFYTNVYQDVYDKLEREGIIESVDKNPSLYGLSYNTRPYRKKG